MTKDQLTGNPQTDAQFLLDVIMQLISNPRLNLGDLVYNIRESEGEGWEGPAVVAWGNAVENAQAVVDKYKAQAPANYLDFYSNTNP